MKPNWKKIGIIVVVIIFILGPVKDLLIKTVITSVGPAVIGAPIQLDWFSWNLLTSRLDVYGLKIDNPKDFPKGTFVHLERAVIAYDLPALFKGELHLPLTDVSLKRVVIVKNKEGALNAQSLKITQSAGEDQPQSAKPSTKVSKAMSLRLDELRVNMGEIVRLDYSKSDTPKESVMDIGLKNRVYRNITSPQQLAAVILLDMTGISKVAGLAKSAVSEVAGSVKDVSGVAVKTGKKILGTVESIFK